MSTPAHIRHTLDIYGSELRLAWDVRTYTSMRRENPDLDPLKDARNVAGWVVNSRRADTGVQVVWIWINMANFSHEGDLWNTAAHEAFHASEEVLNSSDVPVTGEPAAYLMGWMTNWIWASIPREDKPWAVPA